LIAPVMSMASSSLSGQSLALDAAQHEPVLGVALERSEVFTVAGVGQFIKAVTSSIPSFDPIQGQSSIQ